MVLHRLARILILAAIFMAAAWVLSMLGVLLFTALGLLR